MRCEMPKVIQMPRRQQPGIEIRHMHVSLTVPNAIEESESLSKIQRWLDIGDAALKPPEPKKESA